MSIKLNKKYNKAQFFFQPLQSILSKNYNVTNNASLLIKYLFYTLIFYHNLETIRVSFFKSEKRSLCILNVNKSFSKFFSLSK